MYSTIEVSLGIDPMCIKCTIIKTCDGINIYVGGGEKSHIGTIVISQPRPSLSDINLTSCTTSIYNNLGHKDDIIAIPIAEEVCIHFRETTVVTAGVHLNDAGPKEIETLKSNGKQIIPMIIDAIEDIYRKNHYNM